MSSDEEEEKRFSWVHLVLLFASVVTISAAGLVASELDPFRPSEWSTGGVLKALSYLLWMMAIIAAHEAGHYLTARRRKVNVSLPYFLPGIGPIPGLGVIPFFGTFGAFIRMKWRKMSAVDLMAIAGWGPVAGFVVTVAAVFIGVALSEPTVVADDEGLLILGDSLLIQGASALFHPNMGEGMELFLHPIALAGWVGCLLTALNLLPMGQLDGGHLLYAALGEKARPLAMLFFMALVAAGIMLFPGWLLLAGLVWWMGLSHPPILEGKPATGADRWMAWVCLVIFVLTFTPEPVVVDAVPEWIGE